MTTNSTIADLTEAQERTVKIATYTMNVPVSTGALVVPVSHGFGKIPYIEYSVSFDGGTTFIHSHQGFNTYSLDPNLHSLSCFCDINNIYFNYVSQSTPIALTVIIKYRLFFTEVL